MKVRWARAASRHLEEISDYIARSDSEAAERVLSRIRQQVGTLAEHSHIGRAGRVDGTRELVISDSPYIAVYRVREGEVEIVDVLHGARRWPDNFD